MSVSVLDMSMSLDGYIADPNDFLGGDDGERLHKWAGPEDESGPPSGPDEAGKAAATNDDDVAVRPKPTSCTSWRRIMRVPSAKPWRPTRPAAAGTCRSAPVRPESC